MLLWKRLLKVISISLALLGVIVASIAIQRAKLPYNSQGRYFDETSTTVLHEQAVISFTILSILLFFFAIAIFLLSKRAIKS